MKTWVRAGAMAAAAAVVIGTTLPGTGTTATAANTGPVMDPYTFKTDMDGDGRKDTLTITEKHSFDTDHYYQIHMVTAKHKTADANWYADESVYWPLLKVTHTDPVKGSELLMEMWSDARLNSDNSMGKIARIMVVTWRSGKLVMEKAPSDPESSTYDWTSSLNYIAQDKMGYRFFNSKGKHYAEFFNLTYSSTSKRWTGYLVRSKWKSSKWKKQYLKSGLKLTNAQAKKYQPYIDLSGD